MSLYADYKLMLKLLNGLIDFAETFSKISRFKVPYSYA
jgi:hypothetical protein